MLRAPIDAALSARPAPRGAGRVRVPGDKSISHRYALLAPRRRRLAYPGYSPGADCAATLACLRALGVAIRDATAPTVEIDGRGLRGLTAAAGRSTPPTPAPRCGCCPACRRRTRSARPSPATRRSPAADAPGHRAADARWARPSTPTDGRPPLTIDGATLHGITYQPDVPSAQVKSAVLLAGLQASGRTVVVEPVATRDHTERALTAFGVDGRPRRASGRVDGGQRLQARDVRVPGDISSAAFWMALAAGTPGADIDIEGVGLNPTRTACARRPAARRRGRRVGRDEGRRADRPRSAIATATAQLPRSTRRSARRHRRDPGAGALGAPAARRRSR